MIEERLENIRENNRITRSKLDRRQNFVPVQHERRAWQRREPDSFHLARAILVANTDEEKIAAIDAWNKHNLRPLLRATEKMIGESNG